MKASLGIAALLATIVFFTLTSMKMETPKDSLAFLEITLDIKSENRSAAAGVFVKYRAPFLAQIEGATSKNLLLRTEDVQVLHGFTSQDAAEAYLSSTLFEKDVVRELKPYLESDPEIRVYAVFENK